jgi:2-polyprenyl-3-methyl-5-hydroxy-6-metoxy-1,4-benzoquinol methylase
MGTSLPMSEGFSPPERCRLCGSTNLSERGLKRGKFRPLDFHFYECKSCSFLFVAPVLGAEIYDDSYYRGEGPDPLLDYEAEYTNYAATSRNYEFLDLYRLAENHLEKNFDACCSAAGLTAETAEFELIEEPIRWLDFGCGAGGLLKFLRDRKTVQVRGHERKIEASGYDVGSYAVRLRARDQLKIWNRDELEKLPDGYFQIISCIEVVEHLPEPLPVFKLIARRLAPAGLLLLTTGNLRSPLARLMGIAFSYCTPEIHVGYFTPFALRYAYERVGLRPVKVQFLDGLRFKFLKNVAPLLPARLAQTLAGSTILLRLLDFLYGVSAMPSATKDKLGTINAK